MGGVAVDGDEEEETPGEKEKSNEVLDVDEDRKMAGPLEPKEPKLLVALDDGNKDGPKLESLVPPPIAEPEGLPSRSVVEVTEPRVDRV